jgi:hypothetical protein
MIATLLTMFRAASFTRERLAGCVMGMGQVRQPRPDARLTLRRCAASGLLASALFAASPAFAQQQGQALTRTQIAEPGTLRNDGDLDFGNIIPSIGGGTVVVTPSASATCTTTGGLVRSGPCKAAPFLGIAFANADIRVQRPAGNSITLTGPGGATMTVNAFTVGSTAPTTYLGWNGANHRLRVNAADGAYLFYVGGTLNVAANQAAGIYTGTFQIRITYN